MHFFIDMSLKIVNINQMVFLMNVSLLPYNIILGPKSLLTKNLKLLISTYCKENMIILLQNKIQVPNKSKL